MVNYAITGDDTLTIYDRVITDFIDNDVSSITYENNLVDISTGKNQNTIYAKNETGNNATVVLRILKGSSDDRFLQSKLAIQDRDFASTQLANGEFVKRLGDGNGGIINEVTSLKGGIIERKVDTKSNTSGDTEQAVSVYNMRFATAKRSIQ